MGIQSRPVLSSMLLGLAVGIPLIALSSLVAFDPPFSTGSPSDVGPDFPLSASVVTAARAVIWVAVRALFLVLLTVAIYFARRAFARLRSGDPVYRRWLLVSAGFMAVNAIVLVLIWPGYWVYDEYYVLADVQQNWLGTWQHILTSLYFGVALTAIPTPSGILLVQFAFGSIVAGYVVARSWSIFPRPRLAYLLVLPFLFLPVLLLNQFPLRTTMMAYIELAVLFRVLVIHLRRDLVSDRYREFFFLTAAISVAAFWRTEAVLLLALIPVLAISLRVFRPREAAATTRKAVVGIVAAGLVFAGVAGISAVTSSPRYPVTAVVNPLSVMLQKPLGGPNLAQNLEAIDRVLDLEVLRENPSVYNIPAWNDHDVLRPDFRSHLTEFELAYASLVAENPAAFLNARMRTFLATNSIGPVPGTEIQGSGFIGRFADQYIPSFEERNPSAAPWSDGLRMGTVRALLTVPSGTALTPLTPVVWSAIPVLLGLVAAFVVALFRRRWMFAVVFCLLLAQGGIVFMTAPASFFMYYWAVYLIGWVLFGFFALSAVRPPRQSTPTPLTPSADTP